MREIPITLHKYLYAYANPVTYEDPSGYLAIPTKVVVIAVIATLLTASMAPNMPALKMSGTITMDWGQSLQLQHGLINIFEGMTELGSMFNEVIRAARGDSEATGEVSGDKTKLPNQGTVDGGVKDAPPVDAGKQGKHVPGHNNSKEGKSQWKEGKTGVEETQQGWKEGTELPDGTRVWDTGREVGTKGETGVRVHIDKSGNIHGYPVDPSRYLK